MHNLINKTCVIIRSTGERTEELCKYSVIQNGFTDKNIFFITNIAPFSKALKEGYLLALEKGFEYSFFIDADHIVLKNSLLLMLQVIERVPRNTFFVNPLVYDYLSKSITPNGPHLYRTSLLKQAIALVPSEKVSLRPETYTVKKMNELGYNHVFLEIPVSLHEFEQYYKEVFRQSFNKYHKQIKNREVLYNRFLQYKENKDYDVALKAFNYAKSNKTTLKLHYNELKHIFDKLNIEEKQEITNTEKTYNKLLINIEKTKNEFVFRGYFHQGFAKNQQLCLLKRVKKKLIICAKNLLSKTVST